MGVISKLKPSGADGASYSIASSAYGTCDTAAATAEKEVVISDWDSSLSASALITGMTIHVKFTNSNTAANPTLKIVSTAGGSTLVTAKSIYRYGTTVPGTGVSSTWNAGSVVSLTYDGVAWQMNDHLNTTYYTESCYVATAAGTNPKVGTLSNYALQQGHLQVAIYNANSYDGALTLNINSTGAKSIYINGSASSSSNKTLPKAMYLVYFDGTNYYFRTDGALTAKEIITPPFRRVDANLTATGSGGMFHFLATSSMTSNKPSAGDGHILHFSWDNTGGWDSQLYIKDTNAPQMMMRGQSEGTWGNWIKVYSENTPYPIATNTAAGTLKPWYSHTASSTGPTTGNNATAVTVQAISTTSGRYYALEMDKDGRAFTNVPWTDTKVTQTATSTSADYEILFSATADNTTRTEGARKNSTATLNPNTGVLTLNSAGTVGDIVIGLTSSDTSGLYTALNNLGLLNVVNA